MSVIQIKQKGDEVFELPDGSIAYTMRKALVEYKKIKRVKFTTEDLIMFTLYAQEETPIRGRTLLFKEIFYFEQELFNKNELEDCKFIPYYYGPYSFHVANKLQYLLSAGLIERTGKKIDEFRLTSKGKRHIKNKYNTITPKIRNKMEDLRIGLDQHGNKILKAIYKREKFRKYVLNSKVSYKYKLITWGKKV